MFAFTVLETMDGVFGEMFADPSWMAWRALLAAAFGLPMTPEMLEVYRKHTGRQDAPTAPVKELTLICGRRAGKSRILALIAVYFAIARDYSDHLGPGELAVIPVVASDTDQAKVIFRYVLGMLDSVPGLSSAKSNETQYSVIVNGQVQIEIHAASYRGLRGSSYPLAVIDELAHLRTSDVSANPDTEVIKAVRGGLLNIPGSMLIAGSTPYAQRGVLYDMFRRHYGQDNPRALVWKAASWEMNPQLDAAEIKQAYDEDPAGADSELGANFRTDVAAFVSREVVDAVTVPGRFELPYMTGCHFVAFTDPSGGSADSFTLAISFMNKDGVAVLACVRERKPPFSPEAVVEEFSALLKSYGIRSVTGDRYAGAWAREPWVKNGIQYMLSDKPASDIYKDFLPKLMSGQVELLDHPVLYKQLVELERRVARGGKDSISHPPRGHDDVINSVAGCLVMAKTQRKPMQISAEALAWGYGGKRGFYMGQRNL